MSHLTIHASYVPLLMPFCESKNDARYYLKGFNATPHPSGGVLLCATNGHILGLFHDPAGSCSDDSAIWGLASDTIRACNAKRSDSLPRWITIGDSGQVVVDLADSLAQIAGADPVAALHTSHTVPIDGTYPDFKQIFPAFPKNPQGEVKSFNTAYIAPFTKVGESSTHSPIKLWGTKSSGPIIVTTDRKDFIGLIMPTRSSCLTDYPTFVKESLTHG